MRKYPLAFDVSQCFFHASDLVDALSDFECVTRKGDAPFHVIPLDVHADAVLTPIVRVVEHHHVVSLDFADAGQTGNLHFLSCCRLPHIEDSGTGEPLVHQYIIARQDGRFHRTGGHLEGRKGGDDEE